MYESGNEDTDFGEVESINQEAKEREVEELRTQIATLKAMVQTRNDEINKPTGTTASSDKIEATKKLLGIDQMRTQIDELNTSQNAIIGKLSEVINGMNLISQKLNGTAMPVDSQADPMGKIEVVGSLLEKLGGLYNTYKQNQAPAHSPVLIDQDFINKRMVDSFMDDLETGKSITTFIKDSLKKSATRKIVNTSLKDIGNYDETEPA